MVTNYPPGRARQQRCTVLAASAGTPPLVLGPKALLLIINPPGFDKQPVESETQDVAADKQPPEVDKQPLKVDKQPV
ncbi:MAG TPA: hypothetical protein PLW65_04680 [Pseudomonadota bacterium]|nr:hypothetical protein [Pseudomonadota bacterium]HRI49457.1 hypothetical protein [Pseudomonadota bacterium]